MSQVQILPGSPSKNFSNQRLDFLLEFTCACPLVEPLGALPGSCVLATIPPRSAPGRHWCLLPYEALRHIVFACGCRRSTKRQLQSLFDNRRRHMWLSRFIRKSVGSRRIINWSEDLSFEAERLPELRGRPIEFGPVRILSTDPPIFLSGIPYDEFLGVARAFGERYGNVRAGFIVYPTWSIEDRRKAMAIRQSFLAHTKRYPRHTIRYICNTPGEARMLEEHGQRAEFLNHKFTVSEHIFRPLPEAAVEFDAIYNARFVAGNVTNWRRISRA